jgi:hypothetical protein
MRGVDRIGSYSGIENLKLITTFDDTKRSGDYKKNVMRGLL